MTPIRRLSHIEHLRGIASFAVLGFHCLNPYDAARLHPALAAAQALFIHGWLGVHVFFALSGWCIAERIVAAQRRSESPAAYLRERALRIFPTYWAALAAAVLLLAAAAPFNGVSLAQNIPRTPGDWLIELTLLQPAFGRGAVLIVSWTLFNELTFYVVSAVALMLRQRGVSSATLLLLGGLLCLLVTWRPPTGPAGGFALWPHFFVGVLAWWTLDRKLNFAWGAALLAAVGVIALHPSASALTAGATGIVLALAARHPPRIPTSAAHALAILGSASYSLYLIHVPVISPFFNLATRVVAPASIAFIGICVTGLGLGLIAGLALHRGVEVPCERWRRSLVAKPAQA